MTEHLSSEWHTLEVETIARWLEPELLRVPSEKCRGAIRIGRPRLAAAKGIVGEGEQVALELHGADHDLWIATRALLKDLSTRRRCM
jgi:hypothetical protein